LAQYLIKCGEVLIYPTKEQDGWIVWLCGCGLCACAAGYCVCRREVVILADLSVHVFCNIHFSIFNGPFHESAESTQPFKTHLSLRRPMYHIHKLNSAVVGFTLPWGKERLSS